MLALQVPLIAYFLTAPAVGVVGVVVYERQRREVEDTVGTQLLNIARTAALLVDPALHVEVARGSAAGAPPTRAAGAPGYARIQDALAAEGMTLPEYRQVLSGQIRRQTVVQQYLGTVRQTRRPPPVAGRPPPRTRTQPSLRRRQKRRAPAAARAPPRLPQPRAEHQTRTETRSCTPWRSCPPTSCSTRSRT